MKCSLYMYGRTRKNIVAKSLYQSLGFEKTGLEEFGMEEMKMVLH